ncbi:helix-turn-helix domain-containing protein [Streptomyces sp. NPDC004065]|uniref:helix-turn-helix domain-containing protein n=1 Tax=Streptomyces sp. NPDC004065 TaxID=3364689 RepID=UPI00384E53D3
MGLSLGERVRSSVAALMHATGESQADLAVALGVSQAQVSRRQSGSAQWSLADCDVLAAHFGIDVLDLLAGPTRAYECLPARRRRDDRGRAAR